MRPKPQTTDALQCANHATFRLYYRVIFTTKYRRPCLTGPTLVRIEAVLRELLTSWRCSLAEFGGEADHVHLLVDAHPALDLSRLIGNLKSVTARRRYYWKPLMWNRAYCVVSVGGRASLATLTRYIQGQESPPDGGVGA